MLELTVNERKLRSTFRILKMDDSVEALPS